MRDDDKQVGGADGEEAADFDRRRREVLTRLGKVAGYAAPVTVAMLSMKARAS